MNNSIKITATLKNIQSIKDRVTEASNRFTSLNLQSTWAIAEEMARMFNDSIRVLDPMDTLGMKIDIISIPTQQYDTNLRAFLYQLQIRCDGAIGALEEARYGSTKITRMSAKSNDKSRQFIYDKNQPHSIYSDITRVINKANKEVFIIDNYLGKDSFDTYTLTLPKNLVIKILTRQNNALKNSPIIIKFKTERKNNFELRESSETHDRVLFSDSAAWVFGQSLAHAGIKTTYLVKIDEAVKLRAIYEDLWTNAIKIL